MSLHRVKSVVVLALTCLFATLAVGVLPRTAASAAGTLLSQGKPATASSIENSGTPASAAVDGNTGTRWSSAASDPQWLQVDLGSTATISQVVLNWESAYATGFQIQTSTDASSWTTIYSTTTGAGGTQTLAVSGTGRYVRVYGTQRATGYGYSLWEFGVYGTAGGSTSCGTTDAALNRPATASSAESSGTPASAAVDGNTGTRWSSAASDPQWLQVDLGSSQQLCQVNLNWESAYGKAFQLQTSTDASTWTTIYATSTGTGGNQTLAVSGTGRYVRIYGTQRGTGYGYSIWEFGVYTTGGGSGGSGGTGTTGVHVTGSQGHWALTVNGSPYLVKGVTFGPASSAAETYLPDLVSMGVNTVRTWGTDSSSKPLLDSAASHGVRVVAGFWLNQGADYVNDSTYKADTLASIKQWVTTHKDNQGVLMWDVGNEVLGSLYTDAERNAYTSYVNQIAQAIHAIDPNHPVTSTDSWTGAWAYYKANSPDLDLYAVNTYGAVCGVKQDWINGGYTKPYLVTESGPPGDWEIGNDSNGIPKEPTDVQKRDGYTNAWNCITGHTGVALGATLFNYGIENDYAGVYFNLLTGGERRLSYYAVKQAYGGGTSANTPPVLSNLTVSPSTGVAQGATFTVSVNATDPNSDAIRYEVQLSSKYIDGNGALTAATYTQSGTTFTVTAPARSGVWKVYVLAHDGHGNVGIETGSVKVS